MGASRSMTINEYPAELKLAVLGSGGVGKSSLVIRLVQNHFVDEYDPTIEDSYRYEVVIDGHEVLLDVLDTAGQEDYSSLRDLWLRHCDAFLICYSITDRSSYSEIDSFRDSILRVREGEASAMVLCGTKSDLESDRVVLQAEGKDLARLYGVPYTETSAKLDDNVVNAFEIIVREMVRVNQKHAKRKQKGKRRGLKGLTAGPDTDTQQNESDDEGASASTSALQTPTGRHTGPVWCSRVVGPSHRHLLSVSKDGSAKLWDLGTGRCLRTFGGHAGRLYDACVVWSVDGDDAHAVLKSSPNDLEYGHVGRAAHTNITRSWMTFLARSEPGQTHTDMRHRFDTAESDIRGIIVTASSDSTCRVHTLASGATPAVLRGHTSAVTTVICTTEHVRHPSGMGTRLVKVVYTGSLDGSCRAWLGLDMLEDTEDLHQNSGRGGSVVPSGAGSKFGSGWSANSDSSAVLEWQAMVVFPCTSDGAERLGCQCMAVSSRSHRLVAGCSDGNLYVFGLDCLTEFAAVTRNAVALGDSTMGQQSQTVYPMIRCVGHTQPIYHLVLEDMPLLPGQVPGRPRTTVGPELVAFTASGDTTVRSWDVLDGLPLKTYRGNRDWVNALDVSGTTLFTGGRDAIVRAFDIWTGECRQEMKAHTQSVRTLAVTDDVLATAGKDASLCLWDSRTGELQCQLEGQHDRTNAFVNDIQLIQEGGVGRDNAGGTGRTSSSSSTLAVTSGTDQILCAYDTKSWQLRRVLADRPTASRMELEPRVRVYAGIAGMIIEFLQMVSFAFSSSLPWPTLNPGRWLSVLQLQIDFGSVDAFLATFGLVFALGMLFVFGFCTARFMWNRPGIVQRLWKSNILLAHACSSILFIPILRVLLSVPGCTAIDVDEVVGDPSRLSVMVVAPSVPCLGSLHVTLCVLAAVMIISFLFFALRLAGVGGDLSRKSTAFYYLFSWRHDCPDTRKIHTLSRRSVKFDRVLRLIQVALVLITQYLTAWPFVLAMMLTIVGAMLCSVLQWDVSCLVFCVTTWVLPPFWNLRINCLKFALFACVLWTYISALLTVLLPGSGLLLSYVHWVAMPIVMVLAWMLCVWRGKAALKASRGGPHPSSILKEVLAGLGQVVGLGGNFDGAGHEPTGTVERLQLGQLKSKSSPPPPPKPEPEASTVVQIAQHDAGGHKISDPVPEPAHIGDLDSAAAHVDGHLVAAAGGSAAATSTLPPIQQIETDEFVAEHADPDYSQDPTVFNPLGDMPVLTTATLDVDEEEHDGIVV